MRPKLNVLIRYSIGMFPFEQRCIKGDAPHTHSEIGGWVSDVWGCFSFRGSGALVKINDWYDWFHQVSHNFA